MTLHDESSQEPEQLPRENWAFLPNLHPQDARARPFHPGPLCPTRHLRHHASENNLRRTQQGLILTHQPGTPLVELWPSLTPLQRQTIKAELCRLLVRMRTHHFSYYGRPTRQPYLLFSESGTETYVCCASRSEWDDSRVRALQASAPDAECAVALERVQRDTTGAGDWDRPVLSHGDFSDRNILVDPSTLAVMGFLDWEMANIMRAYYEYVAARLSGGHRPEWRRELLDVLRSVLRCECDAGRQEDLDAVVDVERIAQGYDNDCVNGPLKPVYQVFHKRPILPYSSMSTRSTSIYLGVIQTL
ncbi:hypothetical protein N8T08_000059 [Aspergillus melleus]|uniref:Uncharacterized protein n=1 Tax=Aspergillus melleus TaxID=138277 RepID=A0ACC3BHE6_9EURO|nr:hypothetical protein N8T08_000059 [Aspergillus melleus]